jgi:hypothetical protein
MIFLLMADSRVLVHRISPKSGMRIYIAFKEKSCVTTLQSFVIYFGSGATPVTCRSYLVREGEALSS